MPDVRAVFPRGHDPRKWLVRGVWIPEDFDCLELFLLCSVSGENGPSAVQRTLGAPPEARRPLLSPPLG